MKLARLAPVVLLALVGCSPSASVAAQVGDVTITQKSVSDLLEQCPVVGTTPLTDRIVLETLVTSEVINRVAADNDVKLNDRDLRAQLLQDPQFGDFLAAEPGCTELLLPSMAYEVLAEATDPQTINDVLNAVPVELNPRYGTWVGGEGIAGSGSISVPAPAEQV